MNDQPNQLFDPLGEAVLAALRASIERHGILMPVLRDQHGTIIDGHHRASIGAELGIDVPSLEVIVDDQATAHELAATLNMARRKVTTEERRRVVGDLLMIEDESGVGVHPIKAIADASGVSVQTIHADMRWLKANGWLLPADRRTVAGKVSSTTRQSKRPDQRTVGEVSYADPATLTIHDVSARYPWHEPTVGSIVADVQAGIGIVVPVIATISGEVVDGKLRVAAAMRSKTKVPCKWVADDIDAGSVACGLNTARKPWSDEERDAHMARFDRDATAERPNLHDVYQAVETLHRRP